MGVSREVGRIVPEREPALGSAREHAVGLVYAEGDQVVHEDADVGLGTGQDEGLLAGEAARRR